MSCGRRHRLPQVRRGRNGGVLAFALLAAACNALEIQNPNDLNSSLVFSDPVTIEATLAGAMRTWFNAYTRLEAVTLSAQARTLTSSWNNAQMNFYAGIDDADGLPLGAVDTTTPPASWTRLAREWNNSPGGNSPGGQSHSTVRAFWAGGNDQSVGGTFRPGFYAVLSSANDVLIAIRKNNVVVNDETGTRRAEAVAVLLQGASLMMIALNYDRGVALDDNTDFTVPAVARAFTTRAQMRDTSLAKLNESARLAAETQFQLPNSWTNGYAAYTSAQVGQIANTLAAMTLAWYPRDASEAEDVDWIRVASLASEGMSSGSPFDLAFIGDGWLNAWFNETMGWSNALDAIRVSTRIAHLLDPASQADPWQIDALGVGNPQPNSPDKRLGDGSFGDASLAQRPRVLTVPRTAAGGTDFAWSRAGAIFPRVRGFHFQSNIGFIRYDKSGVQSPTGICNGYGTMPVISATLNDLLWAEALLRQGSAGAVTAAELINKTRVMRGNLPPASASDPLGSPGDGPCMANETLAKDGGQCTLFSKLLYESEIELLALGAAPFYNQRRLPVVLGGGPFDSPKGTKVRYIQGLIPGTPREMPVPESELVLKKEPLYTWGGKGPPNSKP